MTLNILMRRRRGRGSISRLPGNVLFALLGLLIAGAAVAQGEPPTGPTADAQRSAALAAVADWGSTYELTQSQVPLGEVGVAVSRTDDGFHSTSYVALDGLLEMSDDLVTDATGAAQSYSVVGSVQGVEVSIAAAFDDAGVQLVIEQAGNQNTFDLASTEPLYVLDNNLLDGYQILVTTLLESGAQSLDVAAVVPQAAALGRASIGFAGDSALIVSDDEQLEAVPLGFTLSVRNQVIEGKIWVDESGSIVVFEQVIGAVRFERRGAPAAVAQAAAAADGAGTTAAGAPEGAAVRGAGDGENAAADQPPKFGAAEVLARDARCVNVTAVSVTSTGESLQGLLSLPLRADQGRGAPTLVLLPGSGPVDLKGNSAPLINNAGYEQLAYALGCRGYGVLRVAKLGIPPSTGDGNAVTLSSYADNTADWLALLRSTPGVDAGRLGVIGHSEGGLIALYAAATGVIEPQVVVLLATAGRPLAVLIKEQLLASAERGGADEAALEQLAAQVDEALQALSDSTGTTLELEGEPAQNPVIPLFAHAAGLLRSEMAQDPAALIAQLDLPIVIFQGGKDLQVRPVDGRVLAQAAPRALLLELPNLSHNLVEVSGPAPSGLVPRSDDVVSRTLIEALATFLNGSLRLAR